ncbi:MAG: YegS/Rv2252/BmrU family lipid kinase [Ruminococcus sp.]|nr:YegS/Rv2252/BmrU family lipid kinase [Ruminococcus sp.]
MKKMYFLVNLIAGKAAIGDNLGEIINEFNKAGWEVTVRVTQDSDDASLMARYACDNGFGMLVCAGGDGTLSQCLQGIMSSERRIPIGYIPTGSTNDFARSLGIPASPMDAARWIVTGVPRACDVGGLNDAYFSYIAAFGAFTNVTYETPQQIKNIFGHAAYLVNGLLQVTNLRSKRMRVEWGDNCIEDDFIFGMVTNSSSVAGLLSMNDFLLDDGVFEVTLIKKPANPVQLQQILHSLLNIGVEIDKEYIRFFRTGKITFTSLGGDPVTWTRDGEYGGDSQINVIQSIPRAVEFLLPAKHNDSFSD